MNRKILDKINKLLALSSSPEKGEGDTALSMAESLMKEYGVSYSELNSARIEEELGTIGAERLAFGDMPRRAFYQWEVVLGMVVANHFDCLFFKEAQKNYIKKRSWIYTPVFVGHEGNRRTALILWDFLRRRVADEARKFSPKDIKGFGFGVMAELVKKYPLRKKGGVETGGMELMVLSDVDRWVEENLEYSKGSSISVGGTSEGFEAGKEFGRNLSLNRQFGLKCLAAQQ